MSFPPLILDFFFVFFFSFLFPSFLLSLHKKFIFLCLSLYFFFLFLFGFSHFLFFFSLSLFFLLPTHYLFFLKKFIFFLFLFFSPSPLFFFFLWWGPLFTLPNIFSFIPYSLLSHHLLKPSTHYSSYHLILFFSFIYFSILSLSCLGEGLEMFMLVPHPLLNYHYAQYNFSLIFLWFS